MARILQSITLRPASPMKGHTVHIKTLLAATLLAIGLPAQASIIIGGSTLLDQAGLGQLDAWLGRGAVTLTNIYTKASGDDSADFHLAVDGHGPTFSVMRALGTDGTVWKTVGGFNPLSWSTAGPNSSITPADWTAFIFNLSDTLLRRQIGPFQTNNESYLGPAFGVYHVDDDLAVHSSLNSLYSSGWGYGATIQTNPPGPDFGRSIVDGSLNPIASVGAMEVFAVTFAPNELPAPGTLPLLCLGLLGLWAGPLKQRLLAARQG
jgi:hypothetical protein